MVMAVRDRFLRGVIAGIVAGMPTFVFNQVSSYLRFAAFLWADFMGLLILGRWPAGLAETLFAIVTVFFFLSILGMVFAYIIPRMSSRNYILKGWVFGLSIWFASYFIIMLFDVTDFIPLQTVFSHFIGASIWGVSLAVVLRWLDQRVEAHN